MTTEMVKSWKKDMWKLRKLAFGQNVIGFIERTVMDAILGLLAAFIVVTISQKLVIPFLYEIFTNAVGVTGVVKSVFTMEEVLSGEGLGVAPMIMRILNKLTVFNTWLVLFGIRFVVSYITKGFNDVTTTGSAKGNS